MRRVWGQTIGSKARLEIVQHLGTPQEKRELVIVRLDQPQGAIKVSLAGGRRVDLAVVPSADLQKRREAKEEPQSQNALAKLRGMAFGDFTGATGVRTGGTGTSGRTNVAAMAKADAGQQQSAVRGGSVPTTGPGSANGLEMVLRPVCQTMQNVGNRSPLNLPGIPGGQ